MTITDEMIEAAARASYETMAFPGNFGEVKWEHMSEGTRDLYRLRARAALTAVLPMLDGWQPIETAPKDGSDIIVGSADDDGWTATAAWYGTKYHGEGWLDTADIGHRDSYTAKPLRGISHWRPLPPPPNGDGT